jgi:Tfp pilus assembly protein PilV
MRYPNRAKKGLGLIEIIVSMLIITATWLMLSDALVRINSFIPEARHRTQAMYRAQEIIERWRRKSFSTAHLLPAQTTPVAMTIDPNNNIIGTYTVTVAYINNYRNKVTVNISWAESHLNQNKNITESYATDITNASAIN